MNSQSKYYFPTDAVSVVPLGEYGVEEAKAALYDLLSPIGGLDFVKEGMRVVIKANLVSAMKPDEAATTHPTLICALTEMLCERGATVVIGDSPGGLYNSIAVGRVYTASGMREAEKYGATLNSDFSERSAIFPEGKVLREFSYTGYLDNADLIINFCKLKSHGMMGMSCAAKNMFGAVPGNVTDNHQYKNAKLFLDNNAALMIEEKNLSPKIMIKTLNGLITNGNLRKKISSNLSFLRNQNCQEIIYEEIASLIMK